ncbi:MAG: hypothetical protein II293_00675, partial [Bacteroidaceae bacterium]|nr:hypothetical protein [Bacteroidaceae bacterium]
DETVFEKKVLNFGFTERIPELMDASDFLVTKPGGITVSEALAKELPMQNFFVTFLCYSEFFLI